MINEVVQMSRRISTCGKRGLVVARTAMALRMPSAALAALLSRVSSALYLPHRRRGDKEVRADGQNFPVQCQEQLVPAIAAGSLVRVQAAGTDSWLYDTHFPSTSPISLASALSPSRMSAIKSIPAVFTYARRTWPRRHPSPWPRPPWPRPSPSRPSSAETPSPPAPAIHIDASGHSGACCKSHPS